MPNRNDADGFVLTLPIKWSIVASIAVLGLTGVYYIISQDWAKTIIFAAAATAAAGTVLAAGYTGRSLNLFLAQAQRAREREDAIDSLGMQERAMRFAERWNDPTMYHVRNVFRSLMEKRNLPHPQLVEAIEKDKTNVIHILNFFEEIAFARKHELVDDELTRTQFEGIVVTLWTTLEPWIREHRKERGRPKIWCAVEEIYMQWR